MGFFKSLFPKMGGKDDCDGCSLLFFFLLLVILFCNCDMFDDCGDSLLLFFLLLVVLFCTCGDHR
ncbi:MAG TPA: hypothetical protein PLZ84_07045, partial [Clostridia bacterium]|nr:hypothetical protein [Clostridia bacterium]